MFQVALSRKPGEPSHLVLGRVVTSAAAASWIETMELGRHFPGSEGTTFVDLPGLRRLVDAHDGPVVHPDLRASWEHPHGPCPVSVDGDVDAVGWRLDAHALSVATFLARAFVEFTGLDRDWGAVIPSHKAAIVEGYGVALSYVAGRAGRAGLLAALSPVVGVVHSGLPSGYVPAPAVKALREQRTNFRRISARLDLPDGIVPTLPSDDLDAVAALLP